jgi:NAD(P)-dependent dehydrogenase (short-subunit alcohol dehydrogenase family)
MTTRSLDGRRVVVIGASAGIGRAFALRAAADGATVVAAARRADRLADLIPAATGPLTTVACDVRTDDGLASLVAAITADLGQIDLVVNCVGVAPLTMLAQATPQDWHDTFDTNVVSVHRSIEACLPLMVETGIVAVLSSESVHQARPAMGVYSATKAALDKLLDVWRTENPQQRFSRIMIGSTIDTEFGARFPAELLTWALDDWLARGLVPEGFLMSEDVAEAMAGTLSTALNLPTVGLETFSVVATGRVAGTPAAFIPT